ncbi:hypothetical protein TNCV_2317601 [Trichonephila clavipes]|nr:hypothetical protein TNCV_2317601 [Trichonephila clavipes]
MHLTGNYSKIFPTTFCTTYGTANREDSHLLQHPIEVPYLTQQDRQSTERPQIKTDSPLLYEMTSLLLTSASPQMPPPSITMLRRHTAKESTAPCELQRTVKTPH